uniref:C-type lectin domain-containing protein n=1 Tax=Cyprinus carpio TaxID=7962 RepID=A0A8C2GKR2_CYPCA
DQRICVSSHGRKSVCAASAVRLVWSFVICTGIYDDVFTYRWFNMLILTGLFWSSSALSRKYYYINVRMSWPEAQRYCRSKYTDLATVDSMSDVNRLVNIVDAGYSGSVWIGLKRGTQKRWGWSNGENTTSQYYNWASGQPNVNEDYCVVIYSGGWHDMSCGYKQYFVCYGDFPVILNVLLCSLNRKEELRINTFLASLNRK